VALWPGNGLAQTLPKRALIGFLGASSKSTGARYYRGFPQGMSELGYSEGRDYLLEERYADGQVTKLPLLAQQLVALRPDAIVVSNTAAALAARQVTASIPIVCGTFTDPVGMGLVASEARPGGNVTGILLRLDGLTGKQLELALDLVPGATRIGVLVNVNNPSNVVQRRDAEPAAKKLGVTLVPVEVRTADEVDLAFQTLLRERADIVVVLSDAMFTTVRRQIAAFALVSRLPTVFGLREHVEDGGLISYGTDQLESFRRAAYYVDRILKGDKPADLPVEFPTKVELVINLATAKALALTVPPNMLAIADDVIE
jgi:putative ABC transport system substrate-binding protein